MKSHKSQRKTREAHTMMTKHGMGDYYGSGIKNPMGKVRDGMGINPLTPKMLKKPPRSLG